MAGIVATQKKSGIAGVSNDGAARILEPYQVLVAIQGVADLLLHRYSPDDVAEGAAAAKGGKAKKTDNVEAYVYRDPARQICIPGRYLQRSMVEAARSVQDPRSPRKSAKDLATAGILVTPPLAPVLVDGHATTEWEYLDRQRVVIQRSAITRVRPAFHAGWATEFEIQCLLPEYIGMDLLRRLLDNAGRFVGLADFRPTYGRFVVTRWAAAED